MENKEEKAESAASQLPDRKTKKRVSSCQQKKNLDSRDSTRRSGIPSEPKGRGEKRSKRKKSCESFKKQKHVDDRDGASLHISPKSSQSPDRDLKPDDSESPPIDESRESSNSSQEDSDLLCMSMLLKSILDKKKLLLLESPEVLQFFKQQNIKQEEPGD